ncbi:MAG: hypothetical protein ACLQU2_22700, partial [Candidatus Binataceae bacterium]
MAEIHEGGCLCGAVRYQVIGQPKLQIAFAVEAESLDDHLIAARRGASGKGHALAWSRQCRLPLIG